MWPDQDDNEMQNQKQNEKLNEYLLSCSKEKLKLSSEEFPIACRLIDTEIKNSENSGRAAHDDRYVDLYNAKPIKVHTRVLFPSKDVSSFNFVGKLLGPKGTTLKMLQEETRCRMLILGRGSMRDQAKEDECRASGDPKYSHLSDELHVDVSCVAPPTEAYSRIAFAFSRLKLIMVPDVPGEGFYPMEEKPKWSRKPIRPLVDTKTKVMGLLQRARTSMEFQPPPPPPPRSGRFGAPGRAPYGGFEETYQRRGEEMYGRDIYYPPRPAPYTRKPRF